MPDAPLQFALPRSVAAIIDLERVPKLARAAGGHDLLFKYHTAGHAVYVTCSRDVAVSLLESLRFRMSISAVRPEHLVEYVDAIARVQQALDLSATSPRRDVP
jgi:hypothetical protein